MGSRSKAIMRKTWPPHLAEEKDYESLRELFKHHIESFDYMIDKGLDTMFSNIKPIEIVDSDSATKLRNILLKI